MPLIHRTVIFRLLVGVVLSLLALSCKQYEYVSPLPSVLEIRLRVVNTRQTLLPFGPGSNYSMLLKELNLLQGSVKQTIYADLNAFRRSPDGDPFNALDILARDSVLVLGQAYVPPGTFLGLNMTMICGPQVTIIKSVIPIPNIIIVSPPPLPAPPVPTFFQLPEPPQTQTIQVNEEGRTVVTVTFDMDASLIRRSEDFELHPHFYISSVKNY